MRWVMQGNLVVNTDGPVKSDGPIGVVVVAAGSGTRLGSDLPKAFVLVDHASVLEHALRGVIGFGPAQIVVAAPAGFESLAEVLGPRVCSAQGFSGDFSVVTGGHSRGDSVRRGLSALGQQITRVLIHDAARALTPPQLFHDVADAISVGVGVVPGLPVVDSLKQISGTAVLGVVDRELLLRAQTPQGFPLDLLAAAYQLPDSDSFTDDAALFSAAGHQVHWVTGAEAAFKVTTADDLLRAQQLVRAETNPSAALRVGVGTDVHAFGGEGALWLAGLEWSGEPRLSGHSDGDVVAHAIVDALLSAAGLGDIGTHFGTDRPEYSAAHAAAFLQRTAQILSEAGWGIVNVSVQFQGNRPRFSGRRPEAEQVLSAALGGAVVSVSATTTDGLGFTGRGEGIAATAVALISRR